MLPHTRCHLMNTIPNTKHKNLNYKPSLMELQTDVRCILTPIIIIIFLFTIKYKCHSPDRTRPGPTAPRSSTSAAPISHTQRRDQTPDIPILFNSSCLNIYLRFPQNMDKYFGQSDPHRFLAHLSVKSVASVSEYCSN